MPRIGNLLERLADRWVRVNRPPCDLVEDPVDRRLNVCRTLAAHRSREGFSR
jgi:hypothetical protein